MDVQYVWTKDGLKLQGVHYSPAYKDICVVLIHGMGGNFIENMFGDVLGRKLSENNIGFIYAHNRGYSHINDIDTNKEVAETNGHKVMRIGVTYERFEESVLDIDAWVKRAIDLGYKKVILAGHSMGANKVVRYYSEKQPEKIFGIIFLSPPDMVANGKENGKSTIYESLLAEAKENVAHGDLRKLLSKQLWDYYTLSSQTFLDLFEEGCPADNLPLLRNPEVFTELASIDKPILAVMGELDDIVVRSLEEDLNLLEKKAIKATSFTKLIVKGANHTYEDQEEKMAKEVNAWLKNNFF